MMVLLGSIFVCAAGIFGKRDFVEDFKCLAAKEIGWWILHWLRPMLHYRAGLARMTTVPYTENPVGEG
jgi:hypothetical protein